jgi:hypothetical protein
LLASFMRAITPALKKMIVREIHQIHTIVSPAIEADKVPPTTLPQPSIEEVTRPYFPSPSCPAGAETSLRE